MEKLIEKIFLIRMLITFLIEGKIVRFSAVPMCRSALNNIVVWQQS